MNKKKLKFNQKEEISYYNYYYNTWVRYLSALSVILAHPDRSSFRSRASRTPRNPRSDTPVYEASKQRNLIYFTIPVLLNVGSKNFILKS